MIGTLLVGAAFFYSFGRHYVELRNQPRPPVVQQSWEWEGITPEVARARYARQIAELPSAQREETEQWLTDPNIRIEDLALERPLALYTQGEGIPSAVREDLLPKVPPGTFRLLTVPTGNEWEFGFLLEDKGLLPVTNRPRRYPSESVWVSEVKTLDPVRDLLAKIFNWERWTSTPLGARLVTDEEGRLHLLVFTSA